MPIPIIVAVSGLGADALAVRLDSNIFATTDDFRVPTWAIMTNITDAASVSTTIANARNAMMQFRHIMAIPPFLVKVILNAASKDPAQLIVDCFAAMTAFNTLHTGDATYPNATDNCKRIIYFFWAAAHDSISVTVSIPQHNGTVKQYLSDLFKFKNFLLRPNRSSSSPPLSHPTKKGLCKIRTLRRFSNKQRFPERYTAL